MTEKPETATEEARRIIDEQWEEIAKDMAEVIATKYLIATDDVLAMLVPFRMNIKVVDVLCSTTMLGVSSEGVRAMLDALVDHNATQAVLDRMGATLRKSEALGNE